MHGPIPARLTPHVERTAGLPLISIVIPAFNAAEYLKPCLASVLREVDAARTLGKGECEVILVDDCSADATGGLARELLGERKDARVTTHQTNRGAAAARNTGIDASRGDYILFLDSDNTLLEGALLRILDALLEHADAEVLILGMDLIDESGERTGVFYGDRVPANPIGRLQADPFLLLDGNCMDAFGIVRTSAARAARYDESLSQLSDWDFWLRLRYEHRCRFAMLQESVGGYRIRPGQMSQIIPPQSGPHARETLQVLGKALGMAMHQGLTTEAIRRVLARVNSSGSAYLELSAHAAVSAPVRQSPSGSSDGPIEPLCADLATIQLNFGARTLAFAFRSNNAGDKEAIYRVFHDDDLNLSHWEQGRRFLSYYAASTSSRPGLIIDAGAGIGASAVYFLEIFRNSIVCTIEPDKGNFSILELNTRGYRNKTNLHAALAASDGVACRERGIPAVSVLSILKAAATTLPMILKCGMECAENGVFSAGPDWMRQFPLIIGSANSMQTVAQHDFDILTRGDHAFLFNRALLASS